MIAMQQIKESRRLLHGLGFPDPGLLGSASYTLYESVEVSELVFLDYRPNDMRARDKSKRDKMDKELGQVLYMGWTTLMHCPGVMTPNIEYDRFDASMSNLSMSFQMIEDALNAVRSANRGAAASVEMYITEVISNAYQMARRYNVDPEAAMWKWVNSIEEKLRGAKR